MSNSEHVGDGGPVFSRESRHAGHNGMTLRDYFAAKAMQGMLANPYCAQKIDSSESSGDVGKAAYYHADAMLAARSQP